jgi:RNA-directed DNA polymerase
VRGHARNRTNIVPGGYWLTFASSSSRETPEVLVYLTRWVRLRLRAALWRQWKTYRRRRAALIALGVRPRLAGNTAGSGRGPWYLARSKALSVGLSNAYFQSLGLPSLVEGC